MRIKCSLVTYFLICTHQCFCLLGNPYEILEIDRYSKITEIKNAYKALIRKWHPDKNPTPEAKTKIIEINKAYELLKDPQRRADYDKHGITEDTPNFRRRPDYSDKAHVVAIINEHAQGLLGRILKKIMIITDGISDNIGKREMLPVLSVIVSLGFIVLIGFIMQHVVKLEEQSIQERYRKLGKVPPGSRTRPECKLNIHELRGETYNGLIRLLKPGCRTIVLLCDAESKPKLLPLFYRCVYPYRRNKTLLFAYLLVEKNIDWYKKLLLQTLVEYQDLNINPKNCIGTVLSLNGFRKYFCVYHAKHPEKQARRRRKLEEGAAATSGTAVDGEFLGFESEEEEEKEEDVEAGTLINKRLMRQVEADGDSLNNILFEENLLDDFPNWLERLFEGTTHRCHIQYWPEHMK